MLSLGSSVHWHDALAMLTGTRDISAEPLLEYYEPLMRTLKLQSYMYVTIILMRT